MNYVEENLRKDEKILAQATFSLASLVGVIIFSIFNLLLSVVLFFFFPIFGIIPLIISVIVFISRIVSFKQTCLAVTNMRIVGKTGVFSLSAVDVPIDKIGSADIFAGIFGNLFGFYNLKITGIGGTKIRSFYAVKNGPELKNILFDAMEQHEENKRVAQAQAIANAMSQRPQ